MNFKTLALTALAATTLVSAPAQAFWGGNSFNYDDQYGGGTVVVEGTKYTWSYETPNGGKDQYTTEILGCVALPSDGGNRVLECTEMSETGIYPVGVYITDDSVSFTVMEDGGAETTTINGTNTFSF